MSLPEKERVTPRSIIWINALNAVYYACKNQFDEAHRFIAKQFDFVKQYYPSVGMQSGFMIWHAWILEKENRIEESKGVREKSQKLVAETQERFAHVNIQAGLVSFVHPDVNQAFEMRLDVVNASRNRGVVLKVEGLLVPELKVIEASPNCFVKNDCVKFKDNLIKPFEVKTIKLTVTAAKPSTFNLAPTVTYVDDKGQTKTSSTRQFTITVKPLAKKVQIPGRISTGFSELDRMLLGGIPDGFAVALTSSSSNERDDLIERFVRAGGEEGAITFYLVENPRKATALAGKFSSVYAFVCNPKADFFVGELPNVFKLKGVDNLTDIDIALTKASRQLDASQPIPKHACIEIISDVLLQHHLVTTKKWLSSLLQDLKSKGFTTLAVIDPTIHQPQETQAIRSLFDGEIEIRDEGSAKILRIRKLYKQEYLQEELALTKGM
jgi:hypothetical protein